jgi:hypothetical protein
MFLLDQRFSRCSDDGSVVVRRRVIVLYPSASSAADKKYQSSLSVHGSRHGGVHFPLLSPTSLHQRLPFPSLPEPVQLLLTLCSTQTDSDNRFIHRLFIGLLIAKLCAHRESPDVVLDLHVHTSSYSLRPHPASNTKLIHSSLASVDNHVVLNA